jgi:hypothetical protein
LRNWLGDDQNAIKQEQEAVLHSIRVGHGHAVLATIGATSLVDRQRGRGQLDHATRVLTRSSIIVPGVRKLVRSKKRSKGDDEGEDWLG